MKKSIISFFLFFTIANITFSQHAVIWKKWKLKYETPEKLNHYRTGARNVFGRDNANYAVDIEAVPFTQECKSFIESIEYAANEVAETMGHIKIKHGDYIPKIKKAYYVIAEDVNSKGISHPVVILVILDEKHETAFEITIDCYNNDIAKGIQIAKSFEFIY